MTIHILVAGGGCSGLSLAYQLSKTDRRFEMSIFEVRQSYERDKTWCQWNTSKHDFQNCVVNEWNRWNVRQDDKTVHQKSKRSPYQMIDAGRFYENALKTVKNDSRIRLKKNTPVQETKNHRSGVRLITNDQDYHGDWFIETRPPELSSNELLQHFLGWEVEFEKDRLDPDEVVLMDFWSDHQAGVHFMYILPFSSKKGLLEATWISNELLPEDEYKRMLRKYIDQELEANCYEVHYEELGAIPLETAYKTDHNQRQITIGTAGGATRPSTGYTFQGIQNQVKKLVDQFVNEQLNPGPIDAWNRTNLFLDAPLLSLIDNNPKMAQEAIFELFKGTNGNQLARFLTGKQNLRDLTAVIRSMPSIPMIRHSMQVFVPGL